jgi:hypothetical protein
MGGCQEHGLELNTDCGDSTVASWGLVNSECLKNYDRTLNASGRRSVMPSFVRCVRMHLGQIASAGVAAKMGSLHMLSTVAELAV